MLGQLTKSFLRLTMKINWISWLIIHLRDRVKTWKWIDVSSKTSNQSNWSVRVVDSVILNQQEQRLDLWDLHSNKTSQDYSKDQKSKCKRFKYKTKIQTTKMKMLFIRKLNIIILKRMSNHAELLRSKNRHNC